MLHRTIYTIILPEKIYVIIFVSNFLDKNQQACHAFV